MLLTLGTAGPQVAPYIDGGTCSRAAWVKAINDAIRYILIFGDWKYTVRRFRLKTKNNTVTLPDGVEKILRYNRDCNPARAFGMPYQFMDSGPGDITAARNCGSPHLQDLGMFPVFFEPPEKLETRLVAFSTDAADTSKSLTIYGLDSLKADKIVSGSASRQFALPINQFDGGVEGRVVNIASKQQCAVWLPIISQVIKPVTNNYITVYAYEPAAKRMWFIAKYHPRETQPLYRRFKVLAPDITSGAFIEALVKLGYVEAVDDNDPLIIQNVDALIAVIQAQKALKNEDGNRHDGHLLRAKGILNVELNNYNQHENEFDVQCESWGFGGVICPR